MNKKPNEKCRITEACRNTEVHTSILIYSFMYVSMISFRQLQLKIAAQWPVKNDYNVRLFYKNL